MRTGTKQLERIQQFGAVFLRMCCVGVLLAFLGACSIKEFGQTTVFEDRFALYTVVEEAGQAKLYGVDEGGRTLLRTGTLGSMWYKADTERLYFIEGNHVYRYSFRDGGEEIIYTSPFEDITIDQIIVRSDEQQYAVLLRSSERAFDGMVACGLKEFCILEVGNFQEGSAKLVALPEAYQYSFLGAWDRERAHPYLYIQPRATKGSYQYVLLDDEGSGIQSLVVRQLGVELPTVELYSNDLRLEIFTFPAVEERNPEGWRIFYFRSAEEIYHRFREEFIIPRDVRALPAPDMKRIAYVLDDKLFIFSVEERVFLYKDEQVGPMKWVTPTMLVYQKGDQATQLDLVNDVYVEWGDISTCGGVQYKQQLEEYLQSVTVTALRTDMNLHISGKNIPFIFCGRDKTNSK